MKSRPKDTEKEVKALMEHLSTYPGLTTEFVTQDELLAGIFLQDDSMAKTFAENPDLMLVDSTHKTNRLRMPLFFLVTLDGNGESEVVAAFIVVNEGAEVLSDMVETFKKFNPSWQSIKVILTDKDLAERKVFKDHIPQAALQICLFHVMRSFRREITAEKMNITQEQRLSALEIIRNICYARSEADYQQKYQHLKDSCDSRIVNYFTNNC